MLCYALFMKPEKIFTWKDSELTHRQIEETISDLCVYLRENIQEFAAEFSCESCLDLIGQLEENPMLKLQTASEFDQKYQRTDHTFQNYCRQLRQTLIDLLS